MPQDKSSAPAVEAASTLYPAAMPPKLSKPRPRQGARLASLRRAAGLTQVELAQLIGEAQPNIAYWEQSEKPPRSDVLPKLAKIFGVSVDHLLSSDVVPERRRGPVGRLQKLFDGVSRLPRRQQDKLIEFIEAFIDRYERTTR